MEEMLKFYFFWASGMVAVFWLGAICRRSKPMLISAAVVTALLIFGCTSNNYEYGTARMQSDGACAPYALAKYLEITMGNIIPDSDVEAMYQEARAIDGLSDDEGGTNMRATMSVATSRGLVASYTSLWSAEEVRVALDTSPVLLALPVRSGSSLWGGQYWNMSGDTLGMHTVNCVGYKGGLFSLLNNFGPCWGSNGLCWIWEDQLQALFDAGEASAWVVK